MDVSFILNPSELNVAKIKNYANYFRKTKDNT